MERFMPASRSGGELLACSRSLGGRDPRRIQASAGGISVLARISTGLTASYREAMARMSMAWPRWFAYVLAALVTVYVLAGVGLLVVAPDPTHVVGFAVGAVLALASTVVG